eukprot:403372549
MEFKSQLPEQNDILEDAIQIQRQKGERLIIIGMKYLLFGIGSLIVLNACQEFFNNSLHTDRKLKFVHSSLIWGYYILRNYYYYNYFNPDFLFYTVILIFLTDLGALQQESSLKCIQNLSASKENEMKESFQSTLQVIPQGVLVIDKQTKRLCYANQEAAKIFMSDKLNEIWAKLDLFMFRSTIDQDLNDDQMSQENNNSKNQFSFQEEVYSKQGIMDQSFRNQSLANYLSKEKKYESKDDNDKLFKLKQDVSQYILVRSNPIQNGQQLLILIKDITKFKKLKKTSKQIRSMFFSSIAHELRTPLNSIIPVSQELLKIENQDPSSRLYLEIIANSVNHLENVIDDALDMNRFDTNKFELNYEMVDIAKVAREVINIMRLQIEQKGLQINLSIGKQVPSEILTDKKRYKQILFNLVGNASKFTFQGGISVNIDFKDGILTTKFFGKVQSNKEINKSGMGLGLTISKMILSQMDGKISVKSQVDNGSEFKFDIPIQAYSQENKPIKIQSNQSLYNFETSEELDDCITQTEQERSNLIIMNVPKIQIGKTLNELNNFDFQKTPDVQLKSKENLDKKQMTYNYELLNQVQQESNIPKLFTNNQQPNLSKQMELFLNISSNQQDNPINFMSQQEVNVFLVDDAPFNLLVMQQLLKKFKQVRCVQTALNGKQAIEALYSNDNIYYYNNRAFSKFDYIFMDLHMPVMDGIQAIKNMRQSEERGQISFQRTVIVALSAIPKSQFLDTRHNKLFDRFLEKPITFDKLRTIISD